MLAEAAVSNSISNARAFSLTPDCARDGRQIVNVVNDTELELELES